MAQCSFQGPCPDCSRGKDLFYVVCRLYHRLMLPTRVLSPTERSQLWDQYEVARVAYLTHMAHCACF